MKLKQCDLFPVTRDVFLNPEVPASKATRRLVISSRLEPHDPAPTCPYSIDSPEVIFSYWKAVIEGDLSYEPAREHLVVILADTKLRSLGYYMASTGSKQETIFDVASILRVVLVSGASGFVIAHNHPSGNVAPSKADLHATRQLHEASKCVGVKLLDHVIIGDSEHYSFRESGVVN